MKTLFSTPYVSAAGQLGEPFTFNNRGAGSATWLNRSDGSNTLGGACYEQFVDSAFDISAAISSVAEAGFTQVILQGHSLGCAKVVHYLTTTADQRVSSVILLAPTDMHRWATRTAQMQEAAQQAQKMVAHGQGNQIVTTTSSGDRCWDGGPISAGDFEQYLLPEAPSNIDNNPSTSNLTLPLLVVYGTQDVGIVSIDGDIATWKQRAIAAFPSHTTFALIEGAQHSFRDHQDELARIIETFHTHR